MRRKVSATLRRTVRLTLPEQSAIEQALLKEIESIEESNEWNFDEPGMVSQWNLYWKTYNKIKRESNDAIDSSITVNLYGKKLVYGKNWSFDTDAKEVKG